MVVVADARIMVVVVVLVLVAVIVLDAADEVLALVLAVAVVDPRDRSTAMSAQLRNCSPHPQCVSVTGYCGLGPSLHLSGQYELSGFQA